MNHTAFDDLGGKLRQVFMTEGRRWRIPFVAAG